MDLMILVILLHLMILVKLVKLVDLVMLVNVAILAVLLILVNLVILLNLANLVNLCDSGEAALLLAQVFYPFSKSMLNRKMVFRVTKSQSMKDKISFIWYHMTILWWGGVWGVVWLDGGEGGAIYIVFSGGLSENE